MEWMLRSDINIFPMNPIFGLKTTYKRTINFLDIEIKTPGVFENQVAQLDCILHNIYKFVAGCR